MQGTGRLSIPLGHGDGAGGVVSQINPEGVDLIIDKVVLDVTTVATGAGTLDVGIAATSISNDSLLDGVDVHSATGVFDNITDKGTNGKTVKKWTTDYYLTATKASGAMAGLAGFLHVHYHIAAPSLE